MCVCDVCDVCVCVFEGGGGVYVSVIVRLHFHRVYPTVVVLLLIGSRKKVSPQMLALQFLFWFIYSIFVRIVSIDIFLVISKIMTKLHLSLVEFSTQKVGQRKPGRPHNAGVYGMVWYVVRGVV